MATTTTTIAWSGLHLDPDTLFDEIHHFLSKHHTSSPTSTSTLAAKNILIGTHNLSPRARARARAQAAKAGRPVQEHTNTNITNITNNTTPDSSQNQISSAISSTTTHYTHRPTHPISSIENEIHSLIYQTNLSTSPEQDRLLLQILQTHEQGILQRKGGRAEVNTSNGSIFVDLPFQVSELTRPWNEESSQNSAVGLARLSSSAVGVREDEIEGGV